MKKIINYWKIPKNRNKIIPKLLLLGYILLAFSWLLCIPYTLYLYNKLNKEYIEMELNQPKKITFTEWKITPEEIFKKDMNEFEHKQKQMQDSIKMDSIYNCFGTNE